MESIAERAEALRLDKGWTKTELARRTKLHHAHLYKVLSGERRNVTADTVRALAQAFGVTADYLLGLSTKKCTEEHTTHGRRHTIRRD
jgi:transcriptional regulator with XRE-family HTH domain